MDAMHITPEMYLEWRMPREGSANPQKMNNPVWEHLIRTRQSAWQAAKEFGDQKPASAGPRWCFDRFGQSETLLPDGRIIFIAGEHEDFYDPDFYIYNDVVVISPDGKIDIYGYPKTVFPPTDFHSATLVGDTIVLIGSLSYQNSRHVGQTQVSVLNLKDFSIRMVNTTGENPGWIHSHQAVLAEDRKAIAVQKGLVEMSVGKDQPLVENIDDWTLDVTEWRWERKTRRNWPRWRFEHEQDSGGWHFLFDLRMMAFFKGRRDIPERVREAGLKPDLSVMESLYRPDGVDFVPVPPVEDEFQVHRIKVQDVVVRYVENSYDVTMTVEGHLPQEVVDRLVADLTRKLSRFEGVSWRASPLATPGTK